MSNNEKIIEKIIKLANSKHPDSEVYYYGSRARGDVGKISDWDLLILLKTKNLSFELETKLMDDYYELELETGEIFSPLIYSKANWNNAYSITPFYENIQKEGIRITERFQKRFGKISLSPCMGYPG